MPGTTARRANPRKHHGRTRVERAVGAFGGLHCRGLDVAAVPMDCRLILASIAERRNQVVRDRASGRRWERRPPGDPGEPLGPHQGMDGHRRSGRGWGRQDQFRRRTSGAAERRPRQRSGLAEPERDHGHRDTRDSSQGERPLRAQTGDAAAANRLLDESLAQGRDREGQEGQAKSRRCRQLFAEGRDRQDEDRPVPEIERVGDPPDPASRRVASSREGAVSGAFSPATTTSAVPTVGSRAASPGTALSC